MQQDRKRHLLKIILPATIISCCFAVAIITIDRANGAAAAPATPTASTSNEDYSKPIHSKPIESVDVRFKESGIDELPDFQKHVAPLLGRLGCNGRACHGSFQGQGGFQLSLFGYDFQSDHEALREEGTERVNLKNPAESLILTKPTDEDEHEGGLRYDKDSWQYNLLQSWIAGGGTNPDSIHQLDRLVIEPSELIFNSPSEKFELKAIAHWKDGTVEDVTPLCRFHSNNDSIAKITESGIVSTNSLSGDTHVVVSYDKAVVPVPAIHPYAGQPLKSNSAFVGTSKIDLLTAKKWKKLNLQPSQLSDDTTFLRRVCIDITGTLPTSDEIRQFVASEDSQKRKKKIDELLNSPAYASWWTTFFCDMTENNTRQLSNIAFDSNLPSQQWYDWIHKRVKDNTPYDEMIEGIVLGISRNSGESYIDFCERMQETSANESFSETETMPYYWMRREFRDRETIAISFAHAFLGLRIQCAQCHKHPFDRWSQKDFKDFSKFFSGINVRQYSGGTSPEDKQDYISILKNLNIEPDRKKNPNLQRQLRDAYRKGETTPFGFLAIDSPKLTREELRELQKQLKSEKNSKKKKKNKKPTITEATLLGSDTIDLTEHEDVRAPVMEWMKQNDNPFFAKALVNRVWARYFGVGIVDPVDDLNLANPPSNAELLDHLTQEFINHDFDLKWLHREITNSQSYQLSWVPNSTNENDRRNFSRAIPRRLPAEVIFDSIAFAASNPETNRSFRNSVQGRAISIPGTVTNVKRTKNSTDASFALKVFGRSERASSCDCDRSEETSLIQTVYMQNDRDIHLMLTQKDSWLNQMAQQNTANIQAVTAKKWLDSLNDRIAKMELKKASFKQSENKKQIQNLSKQIKTLAKTKRSWEAKLATAQKSKGELNVQQVVEEAYLRTLSRFPTEEELDRCKQHIQEDEDLVKGVTGVLWALVNTKEFIVNH
ncbi:MAG: DUF1549 and DUF1553 domain-containing protein [Mariniblastus sp.]